MVSASVSLCIFHFESFEACYFYEVQLSTIGVDPVSSFREFNVSFGLRYFLAYQTLLPLYSGDIPIYETYWNVWKFRRFREWVDSLLTDMGKET